MGSGCAALMPMEGHPLHVRRPDLLFEDLETGVRRAAELATRGATLDPARAGNGPLPRGKARSHVDYL